MNKAKESTTEKELAAARQQTAWNAAVGQLNKAYVSFLGNISRHLNEEQVEELKDLMTEGGLQNEFDRFLVLLPGLKKIHKAQITTYLKEARENAMVAETEDVRSDWFIKYRGRANNYLAAAGFDLRKATEDLEARGRVIKK